MKDNAKTKARKPTVLLVLLTLVGFASATSIILYPTDPYSDYSRCYGNVILNPNGTGFNCPPGITRISSTVTSSGEQAAGYYMAGTYYFNLTAHGLSSANNTVTKANLTLTQYAALYNGTLPVWWELVDASGIDCNDQLLTAAQTANKTNGLPTVYQHAMTSSSPTC